MTTQQVVIIGAGPAGVRAAQTLADFGLRPIVIDEAGQAGGQIYRQAPKGFLRSAQQVYGFEAKRAKSIHQTFADLQTQVDYRPNTLVWNAQDKHLDVLDQRQQRSLTVPYDALILATGATDRILPVSGWTLPGVYSVGGAQVALKFQGCAIGQQVVLMGTGPLLYLVAYQYAKAGAQVAAVLDTSHFSDQFVAAGALATQPLTLLKGIYYVAWLRLHQIPIHTGIKPVAILGKDRVSGVVWQKNGQEHSLPCDGVALGYGLRSETQLADLLGCTFTYSELNHSYLPDCDAQGRSSVAGVYFAGDGAGILGAEAAELSGRCAALTLLGDNGYSVDSHEVEQLKRQLARQTQFRRGLERAFPFPKDWAAHVADEVVICRCEHIAAGEIRSSALDGTQDLNRLKALTRVGMGRCQGRMCTVSAAEILAHASQQPISALGRLRSQAPIKPISLALVSTELDDDLQALPAIDMDDEVAS